MTGVRSSGVVPGRLNIGNRISACFTGAEIAIDVLTPAPLARLSRSSPPPGETKKKMEAFSRLAQWKVGAHAKALNLPMAEAEPSDNELFRLLVKGDEAAFRLLYERYQGPIYRFALHMAGDAATAKETTQEVFMQLVTNSKAYDPAKGTVAAYLFGIARNLTRRSLQHTRLEVPLDAEEMDAGETLPANHLSVLEELTNSEMLDCLRKAIVALPELYREALVLCDLEEMSYAEAAAALGCSPGTIASRLHRARALLKSKLSANHVCNESIRIGRSAV